MHEVVDLFCGVGGLSYGFAKEGFSVKTGVDTDPTCRFAFEQNTSGRFISEDIRSLSKNRIRKLFPRHRDVSKVLVGCAPCQPFSIYTGRYKKETHVHADKWALLEDFLHVAVITKPHVISMENVPRLLKYPIFEGFVEALEEMGYEVTYEVVRAHDYGVPQKRSRLVLFASKFGPIDILAPTHLGKQKTVRDAIGKLAPIKAGECSDVDPLHRSRGLSKVNLRRIRSTSEGGGWKDWDKRLQLKCHAKENGRSFRSVYGRMRWDAPSPVITTQCLGIGNGRFGHPEQDRAISIREAALLQTFPKTYKFVKPGAEIYGLILARQIGNAVPVRLAKIIARSIRRHLQLEGRVN
ncbi:MAG: DNA cytosine methyltransferase [Planctomycetota bacterium]